jgi:delta 1-pyrroline-5-carboxylate dehydrogenase
VSKDTPSKREDAAHISRTPTFIFYRNGHEIGRYVEQAKKSLEQDILDIISGVDYRHYYADSSNLKNAH